MERENLKTLKVGDIVYRWSRDAKNPSFRKSVITAVINKPGENFQYRVCDCEIEDWRSNRDRNKLFTQDELIQMLAQVNQVFDKHISEYNAERMGIIEKLLGASREIG